MPTTSLKSPLQVNPEFPARVGDIVDCSSRVWAASPPPYSDPMLLIAREQPDGAFEAVQLEAKVAKTDQSQLYKVIRQPEQPYDIPFTLSGIFVRSRLGHLTWRQTVYIAAMAIGQGETINSEYTKKISDLLKQW